jgi:hypothetical protein
MKHVPMCDEQTIESIARALRSCAIGKPVSFEFDAGMNRHREGDEVREVPNGTITFRLYVGGGAVTVDVPERQAVPA